jgi:hypothetical protein
MFISEGIPLVAVLLSLTVTVCVAGRAGHNSRCFLQCLHAASCTLLALTA